MNTEQKEQKDVNAKVPPPANRHRLGPLAWLVLAVVAVALGWGIYSGINARASANQQLVRSTNDTAVEVVDVTHPVLSSPIQEIVLPGTAQAFTDSPIFARTNGYLKKWYFDIGATVKEGQLLAEIETPEVDQQLRQAQADLQSAKANLQLAQTTAARYQSLLKTNSVSKQETDQAVSNLATQKAAVDSNLANVSRLEQLVAFKNVYAPFDGVITARNTDIGALIDAGANAPGKELFHLAATKTIRVFVPVPEVYSSVAHSGASAMLTLNEFPDMSFHGVVARNARSIDPMARTLLVEVDVANPSGKLLPGAYATVHFKLPAPVRSAVIPSNTLLFRSEGLRVAIVRDGRAILTPIGIGRDFGSTVEVVSGLQTTDVVILNPADSLTSGSPVRVNAKPATEAAP